MPSAHSAETGAILAEAEEKVGWTAKKVDIKYHLRNRYSQESLFSRRLIHSSRANTDETAIFEKVGQLPKLFEIGF